MWPAATAEALRMAENAMRRASERKLEEPDLLFVRYDIAFLRADKAGMEREAALGQGMPGADDLMADKEAFALAYSGHLQQARKKSKRAAELAQQAAQRESSALYEAGAALREALFGNV